MTTEEIEAMATAIRMTDKLADLGLISRHTKDECMEALLEILNEQ